MKRIISILLAVLFVIITILYLQLNSALSEGDAKRILVQIVMVCYYLLTIVALIIYSTLKRKNRLSAFTLLAFSVILLTANFFLFVQLQDQGTSHIPEILMLPLGILGYTVNVFGFILSLYNIVVALIKGV